MIDINKRTVCEIYAMKFRYHGSKQPYLYRTNFACARVRALTHPISLSTRIDEIFYIIMRYLILYPSSFYRLNSFKVCIAIYANISHTKIKYKTGY